MKTKTRIFYILAYLGLIVLLDFSGDKCAPSPSPQEQSCSCQNEVIGGETLSNKNSVEAVEISPAKRRVFEVIWIALVLSPFLCYFFGVLEDQHGKTGDV